MSRPQDTLTDLYWQWLGPKILTLASTGNYRDSGYFTTSNDKDWDYFTEL